MIYRGTGILSVVWFGSTSIPFTPSLVSSLIVSLSQSSCVVRGWGWGGGRGAKSSAERRLGPPSIIQYSLVFSLHTVAYCCAYIDQPPFKIGRTKTCLLCRVLLSSLFVASAADEMLYFFTLATKFLFWKCTECCGLLTPRKFYAKQIHINVKKSRKAKIL